MHKAHFFALKNMMALKTIEDLSTIIRQNPKKYFFSKQYVNECAKK